MRRTRGSIRLLASAVVAMLLAIPAPATADLGCTLTPLTDPLLGLSLCPPAAEEPTPSPSPSPSAAPSVEPSSLPSSAPRSRFVDGVVASAERPVAPRPGPQHASPAAASSATAPPPPAPSASEPAQPVSQITDLVAGAMLLAILVVVALALVGRRRTRRATAEAEAAAREIQAIGRDVVANVSHELYTPLAPLIAYASLIADGKLPAERIGEIADQLKVSADRLERAIDLLVGYASLQHARTDPIDVFDIDTVVRGILERARSRHSERAFDFVSSGPIEVRASERLMTIAIEQLVDNATKFSPGSAPVRVTVAAEQGQVRVAVRDAGIGIPAARLDEAFEEFRQIDTSATRRFGGLGLGLTFAQRVAQMFGGHIAATSAPGVGSTFTVLLPVSVRVPVKV